MGGGYRFWLAVLQLIVGVLGVCFLVQKIMGYGVGGTLWLLMVLIITPMAFINGVRGLNETMKKNGFQKE